MIRKARLRIQGEVQGVFFRASTREKAKELDIKGFVENLDDGGVFIEAEGEEPNLKEFIRWCHRGPERAVVENVKIEYAEPSGLQSFLIRY